MGNNPIWRSSYYIVFPNFFHKLTVCQDGSTVSGLQLIAPSSRQILRSPPHPDPSFNKVAALKRSRKYLWSDLRTNWLNSWLSPFPLFQFFLPPHLVRFCRDRTRLAASRRLSLHRITCCASRCDTVKVWDWPSKNTTMHLSERRSIRSFSVLVVFIIFTLTVSVPILFVSCFWHFVFETKLFED